MILQKRTDQGENSRYESRRERKAGLKEECFFKIGKQKRGTQEGGRATTTIGSEVFPLSKKDDG